MRAVCDSPLVRLLERGTRAAKERERFAEAVQPKREELAATKQQLHSSKQKKKAYESDVAALLKKVQAQQHRLLMQSTVPKPRPSSSASSRK